jgi:hypothetical protein
MAKVRKLCFFRKVWEQVYLLFQLVFHYLELYGPVTQKREKERS